MPRFPQSESATLSLVDRVYTRLGANDDIMAQKSTFFIELSETAKVGLTTALPSCTRERCLRSGYCASAVRMLPAMALAVA
jgi:hypothetical protein